MNSEHNVSDQNASKLTAKQLLPAVPLYISLMIPVAIILTMVHEELGTSEFCRPIISGCVFGGLSASLVFYLGWRQRRLVAARGPGLG